MKITVTINRRGGVAPPAKRRQAVGLEADDRPIAETTSERSPLSPAMTLPVEIYTSDRVREFDKAEDELAQAFVSGSTTQPAAGFAKTLKHRDAGI